MKNKIKKLGTTDLSSFRTGDYKAGPRFKVGLWYLFNYFLFNSCIPWPYSIKCFLLRLFGAKVGQGVIIKTRVRVKYPWRLIIGDNSWIGEDVWIDNLEDVVIGHDVCISQGAILLTGNHDYTLADFSYRLGKIKVEDGVWIGAKAIVCPGVICRSHSILTVSSVATQELEKFKIYTGNPAQFIRDRKFTQAATIDSQHSVR